MARKASPRKEKSRRYYLKNREKCLERRRKYVKTNREAVNKKKLADYHANKEEVCSKRRKAYASVTDTDALARRQSIRKEEYQRHAEKSRTRDRKRYRENYAVRHDALIAKRRQWRETASEEELELHRKKLREHSRHHYLEHPEKYYERCDVRRARKLNASVGGDRNLYRAIIAFVRSAQFLPCSYCGKILGKGYRARHLDHYIPLSRGGSDHPDNLVISCERCNKQKGPKFPHQFKPKRAAA